MSPSASSPSSLPLGAFSVSLAVKDLEASRAFYEKLGFEPVGGDAAQNWLVLRNDHAIIGLFKGMFESNILTFNPGWGTSKEELAEFKDVRELQRELKQRGIALIQETDPSGEGIGSVVLADPDGNVILIDQHVEKPAG